MTENRITKILIERDGMLPQEASNEYEFALKELKALMDSPNRSYPSRFCMEHFGLEEDYLDDMLEDVANRK